MRTLVAIPAFNEGADRGGRRARGARVPPDDTILVIDDGPTTRLRSKPPPGRRVVHLPFNVGVGAAMRTAFLYAQRKGFDAVVQVDADGQHDPPGSRRW